MRRRLAKTSHVFTPSSFSLLPSSCRMAQISRFLLLPLISQLIFAIYKGAICVQPLPAIRQTHRRDRSPGGLRRRCTSMSREYTTRRHNSFLRKWHECSAFWKSDSEELGEHLPFILCECFVHKGLSLVKGELDRLDRTDNLKPMYLDLAVVLTNADNENACTAKVQPPLSPGIDTQVKVDTRSLELRDW